MSDTRIHTHSGIIFDPLDPDPALIRIEDIAHALSHQCRFSGHTDPFYSVAQHSYEVAWRLPDELKLIGLLHAASEAYLVDLAAPLKSDPAFGASYREAERRLMEAIAARFGFTWPEPPLVREVDRRMMMTERRCFLPVAESAEETDLWLWWERDLRPFPERLHAMYPWVARHMFMTEFEMWKEEVCTRP